MTFGFGMGFPRASSAAGGPSLNLQFAGSTTLDPRITFTRASSGSYYDSTGILRSAANNVPRLDYNPSTLQPLGLLIEEARTNLLTYSSNFDNAVWTDAAPGSTVTVSANSSVAPDGTTTADTLTPNVGGTNAMARQARTLVASTTYAGSLYVKAGTSTRSRILLRDTTAALQFADATINWSGGVPSIAGGATGAWTVTLTTNGWYRIVGVGTSGATASPLTTFSIFPDSFAGTGSLLVWGAQLEAGAFATSYIPTTTAEATRAADNTVINTLTPWFNATAGTMYAEFSIPYPLTSGAGPRLFSLQRIGFDGFDEIFLNVSQTSGKASSFNIFSSGVNSGRIDATPTFVANTIIKAAGSYATNDRAVAANGVAPTTSSTVFTIPTVEIVRLGMQNAGTANLINGYLRTITYYPRRLSNTELQSITA